MEYVATPKKPQILLEYKFKQDTLKTAHIANADMFIHNFSPSSLRGSSLLDSRSNPHSVISVSSGGGIIAQTLFISNLPPTSIFTQFDLPYQLFQGVNSEDQLKRINIIHAEMVLFVDQSGTFTTNNRFNVFPAIPRKEIEGNIKATDIYGTDKLWSYTNTIDSLSTTVDTIKINITAAMQQLVSGNRPNNGLCFVNNYSNMDFSHFKLYGIDDTDKQKRPKIIVKYSILKEKI
jgi:hypothetical protein